MKNLLFLFSLLLAFSFSAKAQSTAKPKVPKGLINTWIIDYSTYESTDYPTSHKNTIKITNKEVFIEGEALSYDPDWSSSTDTYQYTYTENPSNGQTDTTANNNGKHKILYTLISNDKLSGKLVLEYRDPYSITYKVLIFNQLDKEKVNFFMKYNFYSPQQALEVAQKTPINPPKSKTYFTNAKYLQTNQLPELTITNKEQYLAIWDSYISKMKDESNFQKLKDENKTYKMPILEGSYLTSQIRDAVFSEKGYNTTKSVENFQNAIKEYGYPEDLKAKIRGSIDNAKFEESKQKLINTWVCPPYAQRKHPHVFEFPYYRSVVLEVTKDHVNIKISEESMDNYGIFTKEEESYERPLKGIYPMDDATSGIMVLGPSSDTSKLYSYDPYHQSSILGFKILGDDVCFDFGSGEYESAERASLLYVDLSGCERPSFISKSKFDQYQQLPTISLPSLQDYKKLKEKIDAESTEDANKQFSREEYLVQMFTSQNLNPYESIKLLGYCEIELFLDMSINGQSAEIDSMEVLLKNTDPNDTIAFQNNTGLMNYVKMKINAKILLERIQLNKDIFTSIREGSNAEMIAQKVEKSTAFNYLEELLMKISFAFHRKAGVEEEIRIIKGAMEGKKLWIVETRIAEEDLKRDNAGNFVSLNPDEEKYISWADYKMYFENTDKYFLIPIAQDGFDSLRIEIDSLTSKYEFAFKKEIEHIWKEQEDARKETEKLILQFEALLKEWEAREVAKDK